MLQIRLSDADRERLGVADEWLDADPHAVTMREAIALQSLGFATPVDWRRGLNGDPVIGPDGEPVIGDDGRPQRKSSQQYAQAILGLVWMALRRAGVTASLDDLDFSWDAAGIRDSDGQGEGEAGKDPTPASSG